MGFRPMKNIPANGPYIRPNPTDGRSLAYAAHQLLERVEDLIELPMKCEPFQGWGSC